MANPRHFRTLVVLALVMRTLPAAAQDPPAVVQGTVIARETREPVGGATVELSDVGEAVTDDAGRFRFERVPAGRYELAVRRVGYETSVLELPVRADTTVVIELEILPIVLDPIDVRTISVRGRIVGADLGRSIINAEVLAGDGIDTTNAAGSFRIRRVPANVPVAVKAWAFGYLTQTIELTAAADTTLRFELEVDPVAQRIIDREVERLDVRSRAVPHSATVITRDELLHSSPWSAYDIVRARIGPVDFESIGCLLIDDIQYFAGNDLLHSYLPEELERIEIFDNGTMVRLYTRRHIQMMAADQANVRPILLMRPLAGGYLCQ